MPIHIGAKKVLVALPNTATYPNAAANAMGTSKKIANTAPKDAPIENKGVTSPP